MRALLPVLTAATCLLISLAHAATGDLDPLFADHGRRSPIPRAGGEARSVELLEAGGILVGGGYTRVYREWPSPRPSCHVHTSNFARKVDKDGILDSAFGRESVDSMESYDLARQADGSVIAAGRSITGHDSLCISLSTNFAVYRLGIDGSLDTSFGTNGVFQWFDGGNSGASSLALEPDGRIVVAGSGDIPAATKPKTHWSSCACWPTANWTRRLVARVSTSTPSPVAVAR